MSRSHPNIVGMRRVGRGGMVGGPARERAGEPVVDVTVMSFVRAND